LILNLKNKIFIVDEQETEKTIKKHCPDCRFACYKDDEFCRMCRHPFEKRKTNEIKKTMSRKYCPACTIEYDKNSKVCSMCGLSLGNSIDEASTEKRKMVQSNANKEGFPFEGFFLNLKNYPFSRKIKIFCIRQ
jgi:hypothetical protein